MQLTIGCNGINCQNPNCKSCPDFYYFDYTDIESIIESLIQYHHKSNNLCKFLSPIDSDDWFLITMFQQEFLPEYIGDDEINGDATELFGMIIGDFNKFSHIFITSDEKMTHSELFFDVEQMELFYGACKKRSNYLMQFSSQYYELFEQINLNEDLTFHLVRSIFILFLFSPFFDADHVSSHVMPLIYKIMHFDEKTQHVFKAALLNYSVIFELMIETIQECITNFIANRVVRGIAHPHSPENNSFALFIEALSQWNESVQEIIDPKKFINNDFSAQINAKFELKMFLNNAFSFVQTPAILSYPIKIQLLQEENRVLLDKNNQNNINIRRESIGPMTIKFLRNMDNHEFRHQLNINISNEDSEDYGGVTQEFFYCATNQIFSPNNNLFQDTEDGEVWFRTPKYDDEPVFMYKLIGKFVGLAVVNSIALPIRFSPVLFRKMGYILMTYEDLKTLYPSFCDGIDKTVAEKEKGNDISSFGLYFVYGYERFGQSFEEEIIPNGRETLVTNDNLDFFIQSIVDYLLNRSVKDAYEAFVDGFWSVCKSPITECFHYFEYDELISGEKVFDWEGFRSRCLYEGGYAPDSQTIKQFWTVLSELKEEEKTLFLRFVTGNHRPRNLKMTITRTSDRTKLPTAHTCINNLVLPDYQNIEKLRRGISICIQYPDGFGFV